MTKKSRSILFILLLLIFVTVAPSVIMYSQGYRFDLKEMKYLKTGGVYIKAYPSGVNISIDGKYESTTSAFGRDLLAQNLFPGTHTVALEKDGYRSWEKTLNVEATKVTEAKYVILFPEDISFGPVAEKVEGFFPYSSQSKILLAEAAGIFSYDAASGQSSRLVESSIPVASVIFSAKDSNAIIKSSAKSYYLLSLGSQSPSLVSIESLGAKTSEVVFAPDNENLIYYLSDGLLYELDISKKEEAPELFSEKKMQAFCLSGGTIYSLESGNLYAANTAGDSPSKLTKEPFSAAKGYSYKLELMNGDIFLIENSNTIYHFDKAGEEFEKLLESDGKIAYTPYYDRVLLANNNELWIYFTKDVQSPFYKPAGSLIYLTRFSQKIDAVKWLNSNYFAYTIGGKLSISEADNRSNINAFEIDGASPSKIYFNGNIKRLFILNGEELMESTNKLIP